MEIDAALIRQGRGAPPPTPPLFIRVLLERVAEFT